MPSSISSDGTWLERCSPPQMVGFPTRFLKVVRTIFPFFLIIGLSILNFSLNLDYVANGGALNSGSSGVRFKGHKIRTYAPKTGVTSLPSSAQIPPFDQLFGGKVKKCYQWAVVTTIHKPNESIIGVSNMPKWCLVIVGDNITPDDAYDDLAKKEKVFYLSASDQKKFLLGAATATNNFIKLMPFSSFARKNIGYLFAVYYGARVVFDFDDDNVITPLEDGVTIPPPFLYREEIGFDNTVLLKFVEESEQSGALAFNPYEFMRASHKESWPRGFPIDQLQKNFENWGEQNTIAGDIKYSSIGVIQSLCDGDPDNDAVFRMTRSDSTKFTFGRTATSLPILIPYSAYSPYNAQASTHLYSAFWGLYLPITLPGRVTDIWRSYITQRIMKDIGLHVMYTPPIVKHDRSAHDYLADFVAESDLYYKTTELLKFLDSWSSTASTLPERISDLWIALYEHDYISFDDVKAMKEWLRVLQAVGYKYPDIHDVSVVSNNRTNHTSTKTIHQQVQPILDGQPYRSLPFFDGNERPDSAVMKLIMMTMDEWPLVKSWVLYHGDMLGFENLYILDSSSDTRCVSFLRYARDILGANVIFSEANLNQLEEIMTFVAMHISVSSDVILKMDTDEFLVVHDNSTNSLTTSFPSFLSGFAKDPKHPLRINGDSRVGYLQRSIPSEEVCKQNVYSTPDKFALDDFDLVINSTLCFFKKVYDSRLPFNNERRIELGGHAHGMRDGFGTKLGIIHYHHRCAEIEAENSRKALERHDYIDPLETDPKKVLTILIEKLKCRQSTPEDFCDTCTSDYDGFPSFHKAVAYCEWLSCPERFKKKYYPIGKKGTFNVDVLKTMENTHAKFDL